MEVSRILIGEPALENFNKLKIEFLQRAPGTKIIHERDGKRLLLNLSANVSYNRPMPDLLLINSVMPVVNGVQTLELIRANPNFSSISSILYRPMSNYKIEILNVNRGNYSVNSTGCCYDDCSQFVSDVVLFLNEMNPIDSFSKHE